jgi:hypothetical protein
MYLLTNDTSKSRHIRVYSIEQLCAHDNIHRTPTDTSEDIEDSYNFNTVILRIVRLTSPNKKGQPLTPKKNRERTICLKPNLGPKVLKKQTGMTPSKLTKRIIKHVSTNPR